MSKTAIRSFAFGLLVATIFLSPPSFLPFDFVTNEENLTQGETESSGIPSNANKTTEADGNEALLEEEIASLEEELEVSKEAQNDLKNELEERENSNEENENNGNEPVRLYLGVSAGMTAGEIAGILEESEMIDDRSEFRTYIEDNDMVMAIRSGQYELTSDMSVPEIADMITSQ